MEKNPYHIYSLLYCTINCIFMKIFFVYQPTQARVNFINIYELIYIIFYIILAWYNWSYIPNQLHCWILLYFISYLYIYSLIKNNSSAHDWLYNYILKLSFRWDHLICLIAYKYDVKYNYIQQYNWLGVYNQLYHASIV